MQAEKAVQKTKQTRSMQTKDRILDAALKLFCERGFQQTTMNEIAQLSKLSVGSLYCYFKDKDAIFLGVMEDYNQLFLHAHEKALQNLKEYQHDKKRWIRHLIESMIQVHQNLKDFNKEILIQSYADPQVAQRAEKQDQMTREMTLKYFDVFQKDIRASDTQAAAVVAYNLISSTVTDIVYEKSSIEKERLIQTTVEAVYKFLLQ